MFFVKDFFGMIRYDTTSATKILHVVGPVSGSNKGPGATRGLHGSTNVHPLTKSKVNNC